MRQRSSKQTNDSVVNRQHLAVQPAGFMTSPDCFPSTSVEKVGEVSSHRPLWVEQSLPCVINTHNA